jgi:hypothetical protein
VLEELSIDYNIITGHSTAIHKLFKTVADCHLHNLSMNNCRAGDYNGKILASKFEE